MKLFYPPSGGGSSLAVGTDVEAWSAALDTLASNDGSNLVNLNPGALSGLLGRGQTNNASTTLIEAATLTLAEGGSYQSTASGTLTTIAFSFTPLAANPPTVLKLLVTGGPYTITIPTSYGITYSGSTTSLTFAAGNHEVSWVYDGTKYWMVDSTYPVSITPTALSGNVNDYSPTNLATASEIRIDLGGASRNMTGINTSNFGSNRVIRLVITGSTGGSASDTLTLVNQSGSSSSNNQFLLPADTILPINTALALVNDATSNKLRPWSRALSNTGVTAGSYTNTNLTVGSDGRVTAASSGTTPIGLVGATFDGAGSALSAGKAKGYVTVPYAGTITAWSISADTGTPAFDVWKVAAGTAVPTVSNKITSSTLALATGTSLRSTTLTNFGVNTPVTAGDIFAFNLTTVTGSPTEVTVEVEITKT